MGIILDLVGERYGRLTVMSKADTTSRKTKWNCRCDCGGTALATSSDLRGGNTSSCGCLRRDVTRARSVTHGMTNSVEYHTWSKMKERCNNPNIESYQYYGANGIRVCSRWENSFENFYADMGPRPSDQHSIDRIDSSRDYSPDNCRWATTTEQSRNRSITLTVDFRGERVPFAELCERFNQPYILVYKRVFTFGWDLEQALTQ